MVSYEEIPAEVLPFLGVSQEEFDSAPAIMRDGAYRLAKDEWLRSGAPKLDSMQYPIEYSVANEDLDELPMDELTDYYYEHHMRQSTMGIVDHRFSLRNTFNVPTAWQYLSMINYQANQLGATNTTQQYVGSDDTVYSLSFSRKDLEVHSVDELLDMLKKGSSEWIRELYTGSDYIQDAVMTYSLFMGSFTVTVSHIQGGYGKMIPDYYEVLGLENNNDDCLIKCFLHIQHQENLLSTCGSSSSALTTDTSRYSHLPLKAEDPTLIRTDKGHNTRYSHLPLKAEDPTLIRTDKGHNDMLSLQGKDKDMLSLRSKDNVVCRTQVVEEVPSADIVRKHLFKEGKLGLDCLPLLEEMFLLNVDVLRDYRHLEFDTHRSIGKGVTLIDSIKAVITRDDPVIVYGSGNNKWKLLYKDNHFDIITKAYKAEECHCPHTGNFVGYRKSYNKRNLVCELKKKYMSDAENLTQYDGSDDEDEDKHVYYYFFDYETVFDPTTMEIQPYAYAIVKCDHKFKMLDTRWDIGMDCDKHLSNYLFSESPTEDETKYLIGYNNSRFDNFILLRHSLKHNNFVGRARFAGNTIVSASINGFVVRDLCRIVNMSLDKACKAFNIELPKLTGAVKHHEVQMRFMDGVLDSYLVQMHDTIRKYVVRDCESLSQLYKVTRNTMNQLINLKVEDHYTLAGMTYAAFTNMTEKKQLPVLSKYYERHDRFVREAIIGGRSQMQICKREKEDLCAIDCVSLYPYVMLNRHFPVGMPLDTKTYIKNKIGIYNVIVHNQCEEKYNITPLRNEKTDLLDWTWKGEIKGVLCSVDIECLKRHGAKITIKNGIYWEQTTNSLFDQYFKPLIMEKQKQDSLLDSTCFACKSSSSVCNTCEEERAKYNPAIRETCKLLMNSLSGKLAQRLYSVETEVVRNASDVDRFYTRTIPGTQTFVQLGPAFIAQGKKEPVATTPCVYGVLIYAYAREHMYESVLKHLGQDELYGMDTDSAFITHECLNRVDKYLMGNDFGQFKIELDHCNGMFIAPKCYCFYRGSTFGARFPSTCVPEPVATNNSEANPTPGPHVAEQYGEELLVKARFKGVKIGKDIELPDGVDTEDKIGLYKAYHSSKSTKVGLHTFRRLLVENTCNIVCCNIDKLVSAPSQHSGLYLTNHTFVKEIRVEQNHLNITNKGDGIKVCA